MDNRYRKRNNGIRKRKRRSVVSEIASLIHRINWNTVWKLIIILLVISAIAFVTISLIRSCVAAETSGSDVARMFLECVTENDYEGAYSYTAKNDDINKTEFQKMYDDFFKKLQISGVDYKYIDFYEVDTECIFAYSLTYYGTLCGELTDEYRMRLILDNDAKWKVEWTPALILPEMDYGDVIHSATVSAKRGEILADSTVLAQNIRQITVSIITEGKNPAEIIVLCRKVNAIIHIKEKTLLTRALRPYNGIALVYECHPDNITEEQITALKAIADVTVGGSSVSYTRYYPKSSMLAHIIGYVQTASEDDISVLNEGRSAADGLYTTSSKVGKDGLEKQYEKELRGKDGSVTYLRSADGVNKRTFYSIPAQDGVDLQLSIDIELQERLEEIMENTLYGDEMAGAAIVMNPMTGAIDAMMSYPSFDLNAFVSGMTAEEYKAITDRKNAPLYNRLTRATYTPGSTYKVITAAAALTYGTVTTDYEFHGSIEEDLWTPTDYGAWIWPAIKRTTVRNRTSPMNMHNCILHSDNIYFADLALKLGDQKMYDYWCELGLDKAVDFDIPITTSRYKTDKNERNLRMVADSGYGQGDIGITPVQLASVYCAFANGGDVIVPYVVNGLYRDEGTQYNAVSETTVKYWRENAISSQICATLTDMMIDVMSPRLNGTGQKLRVSGYEIAGKTGTAETNDDKTRELAWLIAYRVNVADDEQRLVLVVLELPSGNDAYSDFKYDIARELLEYNSEE